MTCYKWTSGARFSVEPQAIGDRIEQIRQKNHGTVRPEQLVADAKAKRSPLHDLFEWNDKAAAEAHRIDQARHILRSLTVIADDRTPQPVRAFVAIQQPATAPGDPSERVYTSVGDAMDNPILREQVLESALRELRGWRIKYARLQELARLFEAVDQLELEEPVGR